LTADFYGLTIGFNSLAMGLQRGIWLFLPLLSMLLYPLTVLLDFMAMIFIQCSSVD